MAVHKNNKEILGKNPGLGRFYQPLKKFKVLMLGLLPCISANVWHVSLSALLIPRTMQPSLFETLFFGTLLEIKNTLQARYTEIFMDNTHKR